MISFDIGSDPQNSVGKDAPLGISDKPPHLVNLQLSRRLTITRQSSMQVHDMLGNRPITRFRVLVPYQEDQVESGQDGSLEIDVLARRLLVSCHSLVLI